MRKQLIIYCLRKQKLQLYETLYAFCGSKKSNHIRHKREINKNLYETLYAFYGSKKTNHIRYKRT